nr:hypothetical protein [Candidatus Sigynarchaeum springense]
MTDQVILANTTRRAGMVREKEIEALRKKRDIARAIEGNEGTIGTLAKRFHASTRTVQAAKKHGAAWWQERIGEARTGARTGAVPSRKGTRAYQYQVLGLVHLSGKDGKPGYQVKTAAGGPFLMVEGTIDDVLAALVAEGWEILQLVPRGGGEWSDALVRRLVG